MVDVPQTRIADLRSFGVAAEPPRTEEVASAGPARQQRDAVSLNGVTVGAFGDIQPEEWHAADVLADLDLDGCFLRGHLDAGVMSIEPGIEQLVAHPFVTDNRGAHVPPEYRGAVVAAPRVTALDVAAVLSQTLPQHGLARLGERMLPYPDNTRSTVRPMFAAFVEEVDIVF